MSLPAKDGVELIYKAIEKDIEQKLWQRWLVDYSRMTQETFIGFEEYKKEILRHKSNKSVEEMIKQAERIKQADMETEGGENSEII